MHTVILDAKRKNLLPLLAAFKEDFYLAGGTALALQIGHRLSVDFDFFTEVPFDPNELFAKIEKIFVSHKVRQVQNEKNTLSVFVDGIKISFFYTPYALLADTIDDSYLRLDSIRDIGCFKLGAILSRATNKDYIDLHYILQEIYLPQLLSAARKKMPTIDESLLLKSLVYFADIEQEDIVFVEGKEIAFEVVEESLRQAVRAYMEKSF